MLVRQALQTADRMLDEALTLSIVIPAFNEASRLADRAERLNEAASNGVIDPRADLIVVDDGSTDKTPQLAQQLLAPAFPRLRILQLQENSGKGAAVRAGTHVAAAPIVAFMDADMSVDPSQLPLLVAAIENADIAIGSRSTHRSPRVFRHHEQIDLEPSSSREV